MSLSKKTMEIVSVFGKYAKTGDRSLIDGYNLEELEKADYELAWRDPDHGYRKALKDNIEQIKRTRDSRSTLLKSLFVAIIAGIIVAAFTYFYLSE